MQTNTRDPDEKALDERIRYLFIYARAEGLHARFGVVTDLGTAESLDAILLNNGYERLEME